jgi:peptidyl-prolyl cis-trans isomerase C
LLDKKIDFYFYDLNIISLFFYTKEVLLVLMRSILIVMVWCIIFPGISMADRVVAMVDGQQIMESELDEFSNKIPEPFKKAFRKKALNKIIDVKVFYDLGVKDGLLNSETYKEKINKARELIVADLFIDNKLKSKIKLTDKEVEDYYHLNKAKFNTGKKILPGHIVARNKDMAETLRKNMTSDTFDTIAAGFKNDSTDARYFKLNWLEKGKSKMPPEFEKAVFALEKGEISPVVQTKMGYHIIKAFDVKPAQERSFAQMKEKIKAGLIQEKLNRIKQSYLTSAKVNIIAKEYK